MLAQKGNVKHLEGYGQLWDEMPGGDIPLGHSRRHPSYCVDCQVAQYCNVVKTRAVFVEQHQKDGHRVFDPLIDWAEAPTGDDRGQGHGEKGEAMTTATAQHLELREVDLFTEIDPNPWQPRAGMDQEALRDLQEDILAMGLHQEPMARHKNGRYELAFGHRRIEALRALSSEGKWGETVTLKVRELTDTQMAFIALSENRAREDLTPAEEIHAWAKALREIDGLTIQSLADAVGVDRSTMSKNLAIVRLPPAVIDLVHTGQMSLRAARELLCLRNDDHSHGDMIGLVLGDLQGSTYADRPPDFRLKTVRQSIRGLTGGAPAYGGGHGYHDAQRSWRPLEPTFGPGGRGAISFDAAAFKAEHPHHVHVLPEGNESGGSEWTCAVKQWASWSARATREANRAPEVSESSSPPSPAAASSDSAQEWWKAVKRDPVVKEVVGARLRATKSPKDLTEEDIVLLGTRIERVKGDTINLTQEAQPDGVKLRDKDRPVSPPFFDFSECAACIAGASWLIPDAWDTPRTPRLVCGNKQAWMDKRSVGIQRWIDWKETQVLVDYQADVLAINRLTLAGQLDAAALLKVMCNWYHDAKPVAPMSGAGMNWDERTRYNYWPAGAMEFAALTGLDLPDPTGGWQSGERWTKDVHAWRQAAADSVDFDWSLALACVQVWQARVVLGLGTGIWGAVAAVENGGEKAMVDGRKRARI